MIRLDKFLCDTAGLTRSEAREAARKGKVLVEGAICKKPETKISEDSSVLLDGKELRYQQFAYLLLNKPRGVVTARTDANERTVMDLLQDVPYRNLSPVGRLDKDTDGLLLITNDGKLSHELLAPGKHVVKNYIAVLEKALTTKDIFALERGVDIGDEKPTLPAKVQVLSENRIQIAVTEGRFHQIKRMLEAVDNKVLELRRISMGPLSLDESLAPGEYRELTPGEIHSLQKKDLDELASFLKTKAKAVIFDVDGTMLDSMSMWKDIDLEYLSLFQLALPNNLQKEIEGLSVYETASYFKETFHIEDSPEKMIADWNRMAWDKYEKEIPMKKGVRAFMEYLKSRGIRMGIATSNTRELIQNVERVHGLTDFIESIRNGADVERGKPAPDIYLAVADELQVNPDDCVVFEDIPNGILAGKRAGMHTCAVMDVYSMDVDIEKRQMADYYISDFEQLLSALRRLGPG